MSQRGANRRESQDWNRKCVLFHSALLPVLLTVPFCPAVAATYYVDCSGPANGNGSRTSPLNSLAAANALRLQPGDEVEFRRGTSCRGSYMPQGSGAPGRPLLISAYGVGKRPLLSGDDDAVVTLHNQQYLELKDLEIDGGRHYGLYYHSDLPNRAMNDLNFTNLDVHGAKFVSAKRVDSGEVYIVSKGRNGVLNNVLVDGVTAHDSTTSEGIYIDAGGAHVFPETAQTLGHTVTIQNSTAHNIYGDGILMVAAENGLIQHNVVYASGLCPHCSGSTPGGLWEWECHTCTVQGNESYANQTWGVGDGGDFDIDYHDYNNVLQYNYGHDSAGYCISVFGAAKDADLKSIVRYNICSNNERQVDARKVNQGDVFLSTWDGGSLNGVQIYNNTFYWNPVANGPLLFTTSAAYSGSGATFFKNNLIYSTVSKLIETTRDVKLDNNLYWVTGNRTPAFTFAGVTDTGLHPYQNRTGQDRFSLLADPRIVDSGYHAAGRPGSAFHLLTTSPAIHAGVVIPYNGGRDFFGSPVSPSAPPNIGAENGAGVPDRLR